MLTVLPVDPVGELAEGSEVAWGWLVDARGVGVELKPTGTCSADLFTRVVITLAWDWLVDTWGVSIEPKGTSSVDLFTRVLVPLALRVELAWEWLVDTRGVGTVPGLTDGCSVEEITT